MFKFSTVQLYDGMLQVFLPTFQNRGRKLNVTENLLASGVAVVGATVCTHPIDVVKVQLQMAEKSCAKADSFSDLAAMTCLFLIKDCTIYRILHMKEWD